MTARQALEFMERRWFQESPIPTVRFMFLLPLFRKIFFSLVNIFQHGQPNPN